MDYKLIYKPSTISEAITLTIDVVSACVSSPEIVCSWCCIDGSTVPLLPVENPLSHGNKNNRQLLEKPITLERKRIFTIAIFCELSTVWQII